MKQAEIAIVSFSPNGQAQAERIKELFAEPQKDCQWNVFHAHKPEKLKSWCEEQFQDKDAILFIGAMGIAVRTIAPFIKSKMTDPAVLVMDEQALHVISVLSGHLGGGNELTNVLAGLLGADPVITTSSDVNGKIAIDVFAKKNHLYISSMRKAKEVAADIVAGKRVSFFCEGKINGKVPDELSAPEEEAKSHVTVTPYRDKAADNSLWLIPKAFVLGIGCKKGKTLEEIEKAVFEILGEANISIHSICKVASIDLKSEEKGLLDFCEKHGLPISFYSAKELLKAPGEYELSSFVKEITGVDNVCERAAMYKAAEEEPGIDKEEAMIRKKTKKEGVTIALVKKEWGVTFE